jgi:hypothetical protein
MWRSEWKPMAKNEDRQGAAVGLMGVLGAETNMRSSSKQRGRGGCIVMSVVMLIVRSQLPDHCSSTMRKHVFCSPHSEPAVSPEGVDTRCYRVEIRKI